MIYSIDIQNFSLNEKIESQKNKSTHSWPIGFQQSWQGNSMEKIVFPINSVEISGSSFGKT